jgi:hypothetical protein
MNHRRPGKIHKSKIPQPAPRITRQQPIPGPMTKDGIDQPRDQGGNHQIGSEGQPFGHSPGNDGGRGAAKHHLKKKKHGTLRSVLKGRDKAAHPQPTGLGHPKHQGKAKAPEQGNGNGKV